MNFDLTDEQKLLQEQARRLLAERSSYAQLRTLLDMGSTWNSSLWQEMAELGWLGAGIADECGGLGLSLVELCVIAEELGRCVAPVPFSSSIGLAATAITLAGTDEQKARYLPRLAAGELIGTFAYAEGVGFTPGSAAVTRYANERISGRKWPVPEADIAQLAVVAARDGHGATVLALVELQQQGVTRTALKGIDTLRTHAAIQFDAAPAERLAAGNSEEIFRRLLDIAATLTAFEQVGGAEAALDMAKAYVMQRHTFGRVVGSYQAVKHRLADMWAAIELARSNAYFASWAASNDAPELPTAAAAARLSASHAYEFAAEENLQLHGGIGYTWEADCHFHYARARLLSAALGSSAYWSDRLMHQLVPSDPPQRQEG